MKKLHNRTTHGMTKTRPYRIWWSMIVRCNNPKSKNYIRYGAKGIKVCDKWLKFDGFWEDMNKEYSDSLSIDRIDNNKGYSKSNCRWATLIQQARNKSTVKLYKGLPAHEWEKKLGFKTGTVRARIKTGKTFLQAISIAKRNDKGYFKDDRGMWQVRFKKKYIGRFKTEKEAKKCREELQKKTSRILSWLSSY